MGHAREAWIGWRNRLLASPRFQAWAGRFALTRGVARARARALFDVSVGYVYTQIAVACVRFGLFEALAAGPRTAGDLARAAELAPDAFDRLAKAAASLGLLEPLGPERWALGAQGAALVGTPGLAAMIAHHRLLYADLADPVAFFRRGRTGGALSAFWPYARGETGEAGAYSALMAATQPMIAAQALPALPLAQSRVVMDVGGGEGAFLIAALRHAPHLRGVLVDLPEVAERARRRFAEAGLAARTSIAAMDARGGALPSGADLVTFVRVLHDHDDAAAAGLLAAARAALPAGGRVAIVEPLAGPGPAAPAGDGYFGVYLWAMGAGRPRTRAELAAMARKAGFDALREAPVAIPLITRVLVARAKNRRASFS